MYTISAALCNLYIVTNVIINPSVPSIAYSKQKSIPLKTGKQAEKISVSKTEEYFFTRS